MSKREKYYFPDQVNSILTENPEYKQFLYSRGFLITDRDDLDLSGYPFYGMWEKHLLKGAYYIYIRDNVHFFTLENNGTLLFLIGHAYDPYSMLADENEILGKLAHALNEGEEALWIAISDVSGVFVFGYIDGDRVVISPDCCGMRIAYYGIINKHFYVTSHSKLVADLEGLKQDPYITKIINTRYWHYFGRWLPGDLSPYLEMKRLSPNHKLVSNARTVSAERYYPKETIIECTTDVQCDAVIKELAGVMHNSMRLIAQKWPDAAAAIAVTGGRDSTTTLACANGLYDKFKYFSYISNKPEEVDAVAAHKICNKLGLNHEIYKIPEDDAEIEGTDIFQIVMQCNMGCIGKINANDARKRLWFARNPRFDLEIKSWVNELGRGSQYVKYAVTRFPEKPTPAYLRCLYKIFLKPSEIHATNRVFKDYMRRYLTDNVISKMPWMELLWWEFEWGGNEGITLTSEHMPAYDITMPYNNRHYLETMLTIPTELRRQDYIPKSIINLMNKDIAEAGIVVKDIEHTNRRATLMRYYLNVFSKLKF